jgi:hypothetical protein
MNAVNELSFQELDIVAQSSLSARALLDFSEPFPAT